MKTIMKKLRPYALQVAAIIVLIFIQSMSDLYLPTLMSEIVDTGVTQGDMDYIYSHGLKMMVFVTIIAVCAILIGLLSSRVAMAVGRDMRLEVFKKVETFSDFEVGKFGAPSLITRTTNDVQQVQQAIVMALRMMLSAPIMSIGGILMARTKDAPLTWIFAVTLPCMLVIMIIAVFTTVPLFTVQQTKLDKVNQVLREHLSGVKVIRAFNKNKHESARFGAANKDLTDTSIKVQLRMALLMPLLFFIMQLTTISVMWFGAHRIDTGVMGVGALMAFNQYSFIIMFSFLMAAMMFVVIPRAAASIKRIEEVTSYQPSITDTTMVETFDGSIFGQIEFENVTFRFDDSSTDVLENLSFISKPGMTTAIIGSTGSGKSTLIRLIPRFLDATEGRILVNGIDVRNLSQEDLRNVIGFIPQKNYLFSGTIRDNMKFGKDDATDEEIWHALDIAQAKDFVSKLDGGIDAPVSQGGTNFSGGQRQRLAIARALVRKPEIYVFDDSFSALDVKTDANLRAKLKDETKEATVIIVAQRVSSILDADQIIVLEDGKIAGLGTHDELFNSNKVYQEIVLSQLSKEEL